MSSFRGLEMDIIRWSEARGIIQNSTVEAQFLKTVSEFGELADAINKGDEAGIIDGMGDTLVCLINVCAILDIDLTKCLESAYNEIKDRKGYLTKDGVFIKQ